MSVGGSYFRVMFYFEKSNDSEGNRKLELKDAKW